jgi:hypothetical protein
MLDKNKRFSSLDPKRKLSKIKKISRIFRMSKF